MNSDVMAYRHFVVFNKTQRRQKELPLKLLRPLALPIAVGAFLTLFVAANKVPEALEVANLVLWALFTVVIVAKAVHFSVKYLSKNS